jgi:hypothetical protein
VVGRVVGTMGGLGNCGTGRLGAGGAGIAFGTVPFSHPSSHGGICCGSCGTGICGVGMGAGCGWFAGGMGALPPSTLPNHSENGGRPGKVGVGMGAGFGCSGVGAGVGTCAAVTVNNAR